MDSLKIGKVDMSHLEPKFQQTERSCSGFQRALAADFDGRCCGNDASNSVSKLERLNGNEAKSNTMLPNKTKTPKIPLKLLHKKSKREMGFVFKSWKSKREIENGEMKWV